MGGDLHGTNKETKMNKDRESEITSIEMAFYEWLNSLQWKKSPVAPGRACLLDGQVWGDHRNVSEFRR